MRGKVAKLYRKVSTDLEVMHPLTGKLVHVPKRRVYQKLKRLHTRG